MAVPNASMAGREPPHMGPVAHGFAALGDAAERAVSQLTSVAADAVQAPSRLSQAAALLTADGRVGTLWQVTAPFGGLLLGGMAVALAVRHLLKPQRRALATLRPSSAARFALGLLRSLVVDAAPLAAYGCVAAAGSFLLFWDHGLVFSGTETFQTVASLIISTSIVAWLLIVVLGVPLAVGRPDAWCRRGDRAAGCCCARADRGRRGGGRGRGKSGHRRDRQLHLCPGNPDRHCRNDRDLEERGRQSASDRRPERHVQIGGARHRRHLLPHLRVAPGEYPYICTMHPYMVGKIVVRPAAKMSSN